MPTTHAADFLALHARPQTFVLPNVWLVAAIDAPLNVVAGLVGQPLDVAELGRLGVRRVSIGGSLARAGLGLVRRAAQEMLDGRFDFTADAIANDEVNRMMAR